MSSTKRKLIASLLYLLPQHASAMGTRRIVRPKACASVMSKELREETAICKFRLFVCLFNVSSHFVFANSLLCRCYSDFNGNPVNDTCRCELNVIE